jgi:hypothetical protein
MVTTPAPDNDRGSLARRESSRQAEQFIILVLALLCGLIGFSLHVLWLAAVVLMSVLLGLAAAELRGHRRGGVIAEVVAEVKSVADNITNREEPEPVSDHS